MEEEDDEVRLRQTIVEAAVENYDVLALAQESNRTAGKVTTEAQALSLQLSDSLAKLQANSNNLVRAGSHWRREKQLLSSAVGQHQKLLALAESPALVEECIRNEMYHEALAVFDHMARSDTLQPTRFFARINEEMHRTLWSCLDAFVLPRLAGSMSVDAAFKIVTFLSRLGLSGEQLVSLFLEQRSKYLGQLYEKAQVSSAAYSRILKYISIYKVHVSETVLQYSACFPSSSSESTSSTSSGDGDASNRQLRAWCYHQSQLFLDVFRSTLQQLTNGSELALVVEQCHSCAVNVSKLHVDVSPIVNTIILERVKAIFEQHMTYATTAYVTSMQSFSWRAPAYTPPMTEADSNTNDANALPLSLAQWLPLSYALNGILTAFNSIRKCLLPGLEMHCVTHVVKLLHRITADLIRDGKLVSTMEASEGAVYGQVAQAFAHVFYPYAVRCTAQLLGPEYGKWVESAVAGDIEMLTKRLSDNTTISTQKEQNHHYPAAAAAAAAPQQQQQQAEVQHAAMGTRVGVVQPTQPMAGPPMPMSNEGAAVV